MPIGGLPHCRPRELNGARMSWLNQWLAQPSRPLKVEVMGAVKKLQRSNRPDLKPVFRALKGGGPFAQIRGGDFLFRLFEVWPEALDPYKSEVLGQLGGFSEVRCRWAFAKIAPFLAQNAQEAQDLFEHLEANLGDKSGVLVFTSLQGLSQLCRVEPSLKQRLAPILMAAHQGGLPSVRSHARRLSARLGLPLG